MGFKKIIERHAVWVYFILVYVIAWEGDHHAYPDTPFTPVGCTFCPDR